MTINKQDIYDLMIDRIPFFDQILDNAWAKALLATGINKEDFDNLKFDADVRSFLFYFAAVGRDVKFTKKEMWDHGNAYFKKSKGYIRQNFMKIWQESFEAPLFDVMEEGTIDFMIPSETLLKLLNEYKTNLIDYMQSDLTETDIVDIPTKLIENSQRNEEDRKKKSKN